MKICTICNQTYSNDDINYCLADGGILNKMTDDPPPTVMMNQARKTSDMNWANPPEANWGNQANQANWGNQPPSGPMQPWQTQQVQQNQGYAPSGYQSQNQTLPIVSMVLGILGLFTFCFGFPFGIAAAITGYIGMNNANNNPMVYGGRGFAIAGLVMGIINLAITLIFVLLAMVGK